MIAKHFCDVKTLIFETFIVVSLWSTLTFELNLHIHVNQTFPIVFKVVRFYICSCLGMKLVRYGYDCEKEALICNAMKI